MPTRVGLLTVRSSTGSPRSSRAVRAWVNRLAGSSQGRRRDRRAAPPEWLALAGFGCLTGRSLRRMGQGGPHCGSLVVRPLVRAADLVRFEDVALLVGDQLAVLARAMDHDADPHVRFRGQVALDGDAADVAAFDANPLDGLLDEIGDGVPI